MIYYTDIYPKPEQWNALIKETEWTLYNDEIVQKQIDSSLFMVTVFHDNNMIGMLQVIGDGILNFYIQYLVVDPDWRKKGIATTMLRKALEKIKSNAHSNGRIALFSSYKNKEFYENRGFIARPNSNAGPAMMLYVKDIV